MMRFIMPIILIGISVVVFFVLTNPIYTDIGSIKAQVASYDDALNNSKALAGARDVLTQKYNSINPDNLVKLQKLLPDNIDNIRLILEIEQIAVPYGMALKDVKYNATTSDTSGTSGTSAPLGTVGIVQGGGTTQSDNKSYGTWDLEFSTTGTYDNFLSFLKDLESNLRIVDISSIVFSSSGVDVSKTATSSPSSESYDYSFKINTYWLKN
jgi:Tfp pilus assembly protein PilO